MTSPSSSRRKHPRIAVHLRRIEVQVFKAGDVGSPSAVAGRALANDLSEGGLGIFLKEKMPPGPVVVDFGGQPFGRIAGNLIWCERHQEGHTRVFRQEEFHFRAGIQLEFSDDSQKKAYLAFLSSAAGAP